ncbi:MAG: DUF3109 family protein [Paludibacteraceae bacterium]|jgi:hypothetical protein|nr:DUF3109 family protein [Paludibacteraceae bacterium]MDI9537564.1 DUF3109 family protein [Bacteroidota bacterium]HHT61095.1 DUF3109 family protein [Bacteroidales bacterium]MBP9039693.1 DUF3109 family protein [Paludibacteraceae bacterium]HOA47062.1 DUF3109 family protein [Paludibacteraceae bacterium]
MVEIGDTIVSFDLFEQQFCCDLDICKGQCCVEGDAGAPLEMDEIAKLEEVLPVIWNDLSEAARKVVDAQGVAYSDAEGDLVTSIVNRRECVFSYIDSAEGVCKCAIEKAYHEGKTSFYKPISCHLYPIRLKKFKDFTAVTYHRWSVCSCAETKGHKLQLPVYKFLKTPLIRRFGEAWYKELEEAAKAYEAEFNK